MKILHKHEFVLDSVCKSLKKPEYNGLQDPNLSSFFSSPHKRKLLVTQKLVNPSQITPNGEINEKICKQNISGQVYHTLSFRKSSLSPNSQTKSSGKNSKTPETTFKQKTQKNSRFPSIQPMSSVQFREILKNRRKQLA